MGDPSRASTLCTLIQNRLRVMWTQIMSEIEVNLDKRYLVYYILNLLFLDCETSNTNVRETRSIF